MAVMPIAVRANIVFIKVRVNQSEPLLFFLDSGCGATFVDSVVAKRLGLSAKGNVRVDGSGGASSAMALEPLTVRLPGLAAPLDGCMTTSLQSLRSQTGTNIQGILGSDFIGKGCMQIDYIHQRLTVMPSKSFVPGKNSQVLPIRIDQTPLARLSLQTAAGTVVNGTFMVDTGTDEAVNLFKKFFEQNHLIGPKDHVLHTASMGIANPSENLLVRLPEVMLGKQKLESVTAQVSLDEGDEGMQSELAGTIGNELLRRFLVTFDYLDHKLYLEPNSHLKDSFEADMSGVAMTIGPRGFVVQSVISDSPGAKADILPGDLVLELNGKKTTDYDLNALSSLLKENGRTVTFVIERAGKKLQKSFVLRRLI